MQQETFIVKGRREGAEAYILSRANCSSSITDTRLGSVRDNLPWSLPHWATSNLRGITKLRIGTNLCTNKVLNDLSDCTCEANLHNFEKKFKRWECLCQYMQERDLKSIWYDIYII